MVSGIGPANGRRSGQFDRKRNFALALLFRLAIKQILDDRAGLGAAEFRSARTSEDGQHRVRTYLFYSMKTIKNFPLLIVPQFIRLLSRRNTLFFKKLDDNSNILIFLLD